MSYFDEIMRKAMARANLTYGVENEGDYYKTDSRGHEVLYCQQCNEPKQHWRFLSTEPRAERELRIERYATEHQKLSYDECRTAILNQLPPKRYIKELNLVVGVPCKCQRDYKDGVEKADRNADRRHKIRENKDRCFKSFELQKIRFENYEMNKHIKACKKYAKQFGEMRRDGKGLVLSGCKGAGKTISVICLANELLDREYSVGFKMQPELTSVDLSKRNELVKECLSYSLLIIDEFDIDVSGYAKETLFFIIESRIKAKKPTILTTMLSEEQLKNADEKICDRLTDSNSFYIISDSSHNYRGRSKL